MDIFLALFILLVSAGVHELGHAFALRKHKHVIHEICLLGIGPKLATFYFKRWFADTPITIRAFPLGAFVSHDRTRKTSKSLDSELEVAWGGVINNARLGIFILPIWLMVTQQQDATKVAITALTILTFFSLSSFFELAKKALPIIGVIGLIFIAVSSTDTQIKDFGVIANVHGLSSLIPTPEMFVRVLLMVQISIILINTIPIPPLDGGKALESFLLDRFPRYQDIIKRVSGLISVVVALSLLTVMVLGDASRIRSLF